MKDKKTALLKCWVRSLSAYVVLDFIWTAVMAAGTAAAGRDEVRDEGLGKVFESFLKCDMYIALFSLVFGFSFLVFSAKRLSGPAKYSIHLFGNYIATILCFWALFSSGTADANLTARGWSGAIMFASIAFFAVYGISALVAHLVKSKLK